MNALKVGDRIEVFQDGLGRRVNSVVAVMSLHPMPPYKHGGYEWQRFNVGTLSTANKVLIGIGYIVCKVIDDVQIGTILRVADHLTDQSRLKAIGWSFDEWSSFEVMELPKPAVKTCALKDCKLHACIESLWCFDHQYLETAKKVPSEADKPNSWEWYQRLDRKCLLTGCARFAVKNSSFCQPCRDKSTEITSTVPTIDSPLVKASSIVTDHNVVKESTMNGSVYTGHVVRTKTIAAGEGVTTGVLSSEVVFTTTKPVVAPHADAARAVILALAIVESKGTLDPTDPRATVEVKLVAAS